MRFFRFTLTVLIAALVLTACGATGMSATPVRVPLKVGYNLWPGSFPLLIAKEKGFFEKHGVTVEPKYYDTIAAQSADYVAGNLDGVALVLGDAILLDQAKPLKLILVTDFSNGADQVVATASIASIADLKGKRIGVKFGTFGELLVRKMLETDSIAVGDVILVDVSPELLSESLGIDVDAGHTFEPSTSRSLAKGGHVIFDSAKTPGLIPDIIAFNANIAKSKPEELSAFVAAWFEAQIWWKENPAEAAALLAKATGLKPEEISDAGIKLLDAAGNQAAFTHGTNYSSLYFTAQEYIKFQSMVGVLSNAPDLDKLLDPSFIK